MMIEAKRTGFASDEVSGDNASPKPQSRKKTRS
jgi:hypothetical protein